MQIAHLGQPDANPAGLDAVAAEFARRNPGYALSWLPGVTAIAAAGAPRIVFVHGGEAHATLHSPGIRPSSPVAVGDVILLPPEASLRTDRSIDAVTFTIPEPLPPDLPVFLRPDHDPRITDTPGGCATDERAYRRIVLTWLGQNGPYQLRALNAHRVLMTDSFSHYHPHDGGFDELYLVQAVRPGARLLTSVAVSRIETPELVSRDEARALIRSTSLQRGDLVYVGRGEMHRALGGVLAHVITVPGFLPGAEIGLDHHLRAINERLGLTGDAALPFHAAASDRAVVK